VINTVSRLPAMMIPGGNLLVSKLCITMSLHQVALTSVNLRGNLSPWPAHRPLTHPRTRSRISSPPPQSARLLSQVCLRLIYNTKCWFVFFITEKQKNPAGTLSFLKTRFSNMNSNTFAFVFMFENLSFRLRLALIHLKPFY
jgi:hypothetical protein